MCAFKEKKSIIFVSTFMCNSPAMGPTTNQTRQRPADNTILLNIRLDMSPQIRLSIGLVDVGFLAKKSLVSVTLLGLVYIR